MNTRAPIPPRRSPDGPRRASIGPRRNPATKAAVLAAAREILAERGYAGFSFDEVARRAGAGKPTVYRWWPTKADLLIEVYSAEKAVHMALPDTGSLRRDIADYTRALWAFWRTTPTGRAFRALIAEAQASEAALVVLRDKFLPERLKDVRTMFERAAARGEIAPDAVEGFVALFISFNWFRLLISRIEEDGPAIADMARALSVRAPQ